MSDSKKLDPVNASAILGVTADRRNEIQQPTPLTCDGCGVTVYCSKSCIQPARNSAAFRGHRFYVVCKDCGAPFLDGIARGDGELESASQMALDDVMPELHERRRRFIAGN